MKCWSKNEAPADLSGTALVKVLCRSWGYRVVHQVGSHVILETDAQGSLRLGTLNAIVRAVAIHKDVRRAEILQSLE